jgi:hypothetical protein
MIENPEVSQAFYGNLGGGAEYFQITSDKPFSLYVGVLVPDLQGIGKDVSAEVSSGGEVLFLLDGTSHEWTPYFEEFGGDYYYSGPENSADVGPGVYDIRVFSKDNQGKYVLVVGEKEEFPINEMLNTFITLPRLKRDFFEKPFFTAFFNLIGLFMLIFIVIVAIVVLGLWFVVKRFIGKT